ncbi:plastocyanin/azurin family copper-binding protein (plasmid) [Natrinema zhouii]|uniref:plastocyanin/azurin family copper-binding protein n=1 Tax=Natrinema zhouii TaxID=1710539 RepID=UPI001D0003F9|nr:plastocyanin/azurin family copper-binding protein [Natrinema zhouii]UHQ99267.1 plastocyanin/azurin family copper-binding protein [Natrinema zhouii]
MTDGLSRRAVLSTISGAIVIGTAGCLTESDQQGSDNDQGNNISDGNVGNNSHNDEGDTHEAEGEATSGAEVTMVTNDSGTHFEPHVVRIEPGESVTWNLKSGSHTTTAYASANDKPQRIPDGSEAWDSGKITEEGETFEHTFETEGIYDYYCSPHENTGMLGSIVVGDPKLNNQPGMGEPQSSLPDEAQEKIHELNEMVQSGGDSGQSDHEDSH